MKVYCPKHPKQELRTLRYGKLDQEKLKRTGKKQGGYVESGWLLCEICDACYKPKKVEFF